MKRILFYKERFYPKELLTTLLQICNVEKKCEISEITKVPLSIILCLNNRIFSCFEYL